jgi:hypothetical protein
MEILRGISSYHQIIQHFKGARIGRFMFCVLLKWDIRLLTNEIQVLKPLLKESESNAIISLFFELSALRQAFLTTISLLIGAMIIPVSPTTTERTFSKMKLVHVIVCRTVG